MIGLNKSGTKYVGISIKPSVAFKDECQKLSQQELIDLIRGELQETCKLNEVKTGLVECLVATRITCNRVPIFKHLTFRENDRFLKIAGKEVDLKSLIMNINAVEMEYMQCVSKSKGLIWVKEQD
ncbi:hypothetical protein ACJMK2_009449 [Sinanodonta woodiana]|uniref:Uncharacterized protein n=1 Tax=Sinanodonta woodiana TaxID=1069815 RepID=A0ABD3VC90_SINWO